MSKLAKILISMVVLVLAVTFGVAIAPYLRIYPLQIRSHTVMITCGGGNYCKAAYERLNDELRMKLQDIVSIASGRADIHFHSDNEHLVVVTPGTSGYGVHMVAPRNSPMWKEGVQSKLNEWIGDRIGTLNAEYRNCLKGAEQDSPAPVGPSW